MSFTCYQGARNRWSSVGIASASHPAAQPPQPSHPFGSPGRRPSLVACPSSRRLLVRQPPRGTPPGCYRPCKEEDICHTVWCASTGGGATGGMGLATQSPEVDGTPVCTARTCHCLQRSGLGGSWPTHLRIRCLSCRMYKRDVTALPLSPFTLISYAT